RHAALYLDPADQHAHRSAAAVAASGRRCGRFAVPAATRRSRYRGNLARPSPHVRAPDGCAGHVRRLQLLLVLRGLPVVDGLAGGVLVAARTPAPQIPTPTTGQDPTQPATAPRIWPTRARSRRSHPRPSFGRCAKGFEKSRVPYRTA